MRWRWLRDHLFLMGELVVFSAGEQWELRTTSDKEDASRLIWDVSPGVESGCRHCG
jgi:hypothetical protein